MLQLKIRGNHKGMTKKRPKYILSIKMNFKIQTQIG